MIQFLALSLLLSFIEAKGWGGGSSHSYHSTHNARSGGNYHVYQSTYHGGGRSAHCVGNCMNAIYFLLAFAAVFLIVCLCVFLIQRCRRRSDGSWYLVDDSSSSSSSSDESECEGGSKRAIVRKRPKYAPIAPRQAACGPYAHAAGARVPVAVEVKSGATPSAPLASAVAVKSSV